jgi:aminoglycoside phosphotransferase (APT) family kinase protein
MTAPQQDSARPVRPGEELDQVVLQTYLNDQQTGVGIITNITQFPGGYSNLTYLIQADGSTPGRGEYVLRRPPFGAKDIKGGHDMGREFRVLSTLQSAGYARIPRPVVFCEDEAVMGCPFYVMERVQGVILRGATAPKLGLSPDTMRHLSERLVDGLVELHALDIQQTGLIQLGKPEGYIRRQVDGWHKRYLASQTDDIPAMTNLARWLDQNLPAENPPTLLHNDFKYDNVVLSPDLSDIRAVLDWEMCTVGDPMMDLGTSLSYWAEAVDDPFRKTFNLTWLPGNLTRQEFANRYAEQSGRDVSNILYYYVFGLFKNAVVIQQIYARYKKGLTQDERFAGLLMGVHALSRHGAVAVETGKL